MSTKPEKARAIGNKLNAISDRLRDSGDSSCYFFLLRSYWSFLFPSRRVRNLPVISGCYNEILERLQTAVHFPGEKFSNRPCPTALWVERIGKALGSTANDFPIRRCQ